jgi:anti-anti-sigma factor
MDDGADGGVASARIVGDIDMSNAPDIGGRILDAVPSEATGLVIDMSAVAYLDSSGVRMLTDLSRRLGWRAQTLSVIAPDGTRTRRVLSLTGVADSLHLAESTDAALAIIRADR